jgi:Tfp pilus assembly protein PilZ
MHAATDPRFRKRLPCRLQVTGSAHSGMVLNVSRRGLFVQTTAGASPGDAVHLDLALEGAETLGIDARVVWRRVVAPHLRTVSTGGMGLHIQYASDAYFGFVAGLAASAPAEEFETPTPPVLPGYRVRLRLATSPRTRIVTVAATDPREAGERARQRMGAQWVVLDLEKIDREA